MMPIEKPSAVVPKLRFPEFDGAAEWKPQRLDEVSSSIFDGTHQTPTYTEEGVPFYSVENLISGTANKFISRDDYLEATRKNKPEKGDILLTRIGKIGHSQAVTWDHEFSVYVTLAVIKASPGFDTSYLAYYLQSGCYQTELIRKSLQSAVPPKINLDSLRSTLVLLPDMEEQVKIADCLGSLHDLIAAEARKLEALRQHKQGLMQQLFPQPGETVPRLRFPEFREAGEWVQTPLGDAFKTITNGHANAQDHQDDGAYPLFDRSEVVKRSPTFLFDAEAVILPGEGMRFQPRYFNGKFNLHQRAYALMEPTLDPRFAFHALDRFKGALADSAVKSTVLSLRMPIIEKFAIPCPTSDDEQQNIADCLGSLDDLIAAEGRKLDALRQHKRGLMQQVFPSLEGH